MGFICKSPCESFLSLLFPLLPPLLFCLLAPYSKGKEQICFFTSCTHTYQQLIKNGTGQSKKILDSCQYNLLLIRRGRNIQQHLFSEDAIQHLPITSARIWVLSGPTELRWAEGLPRVLSSLQNQSFGAWLPERSWFSAAATGEAVLSNNPHWIKSGLSLQPSAVRVLWCPHAGSRL